MADRIIKSDSGNDTVIQNNSGSRKIEVTDSGDVEVTGDFKATTVKATNLKANDGTASLVIADSTGEVTSSGGLKATTVKATNLKANDGTASLEIADSSGDIGFSGNTNAKIKLPSAGGIHESDGSTEILTESSGSVTLKNTLIDTTVSFSTRSDFGIIEIFEAGDPLIDRNQSQDFSYTAGQRYFVICNAEVGVDESGLEFYDISTSNSVTILKSMTALIAPSIPSSGTFRITVADNADRLVFAVFLVRMNH